jgi:hypothetical protein
MLCIVLFRFIFCARTPSLYWTLHLHLLRVLKIPWIHASHCYLPFSQLHQAAILYNLRSRHMNGKPYTRVGDLIIAVNPFQWMKDLYSDEVRDQYVSQLIYNGKFVT